MVQQQLQHRRGQSFLAPSSIRRLALSALALACAGTPLLGHAGQAWTATATQALPLKTAVSSGAVRGSMPLHVILSLKLQHPQSLAAFLAGQRTPGNPAYQQAMAPAQFVAQFAPTAEQVRPVTDYLAAQGFRNITVSWNRTLINADATAAQAQAAFNTTLAQFLLGGKLAYAPTRPAMVPASLGGVVLSVLGLENVTALSTQPASRLVKTGATPSSGVTSASLPPLTGFTAAQFQTAYDAVGTPSGAGTVIAVSTCCDTLTQVIADLRQFEAGSGLPQVPVTVVQSSPLPATLAPSDDVEWDLDSQSASGMAGNVKGLVFYNSTDLGSSLINNYNDFTAPDPATGKPVALVGNMSYGGCEALSSLAGEMAADDQAFAQAVAQGQTWFASAGDAGAACTVLLNFVTPDAGIPSVEYPAASPYVVAVGGTTLFTDAGFNYSTETAWDAGGGGTSLFESAPAWQGAVAPIASLAGLRAVPDMAMESGGPDVGLPGLGFVGLGGAAIVYNGQAAQVVGTSLSSPLAVGSWARIESAHCNALGFAAPLLYALDRAPAIASSTAAGLHDVTVGSNGLYVATPGWDYTTGYGSFDIAQVSAALPAAPSGCAPAH